MTKWIPGRRKPRKDDIDEIDKEKVNEKLDDEEKENMEKTKNPKGSKDRPETDRSESWPDEGNCTIRSPIDDQFDRFFRRPTFGSIGRVFGDFDREFDSMHEMMDSIFQNALEGNTLPPGKGGPFVYGYSVRTGPDGVPHVKEYSNLPLEMRDRLRPGKLSLQSSCSCEADSACTPDSTSTQNNPDQSRKPITDVMECKDHISVTMELPGVAKEDIVLELIGSELEVSVDTPGRKFHKRLPLPVEVKPKSIKASFKNGVLEVTLKTKASKKPKKIQIQ